MIQFFLMSFFLATRVTAKEVAPLKILAGYMPSKDAALCPDYFRQGLAHLPKATRKGLLFTCIDGELREIYAEPKSPIARDPLSFCKNHPELFGLRASDLILSSAKDQRKLIQVWHGFSIGEPFLGQQIVHPKLGPIFRLTIGARDTKGWNITVIPAVSSATAVSTALRLWNREVSLASVHADLGVIGFKGGPRLVWEVASESSLLCTLDAQTGEEISPLACNENEPIP